MNDQELEFPYRVPTDLKTAVWWSLCFLAGLLSLGMLVAVWSEGIGSIFTGLFIAGVFLYSLMRLYPDLILTEEGVLYRAFFKKQRISWRAIQRVETMAYLRNGFPVIEMRLFHGESGTADPLVIPLKVFTSKGLTAFAEAIARKASRAKRDEVTEDIRKGIMPSAVKGAFK